MHDTEVQPPDPHTAEAKAALCDAVAPFVASLVETAAAQLRARATSIDPMTLELARLCAREVNRLMRGEPQLPFLRPVRFAGDDVSPASLAAGLGALDAALGAFRRRYYGWHFGINAPGWHIAGTDREFAAWRLLNRSVEAPPPGSKAPSGLRPGEMSEIRRKLMKRIDEIKWGEQHAREELEAMKDRVKRGELIPNVHYVPVRTAVSGG